MVIQTSVDVLDRREDTESLERALKSQVAISYRGAAGIGPDCLGVEDRSSVYQLN